MERLLHGLFLISALVLALHAHSAQSARLKLDGTPQQGATLIGHTEPGSRVLHDGRSVRVSAEGLFVIGFGRDAKADSWLEVTAPDGSSLKRQLKVAQRQYRIQRIDGLPPSKVTPRKPEELARIREDIRKTKLARKHDDARTDFAQPFIWPVTGPITGVYGSQRVLNGKPRRPHYGVDIAGPVGTPVRAPAAGIVTLAEPDMFFSGGTLILDHGHGLSSAFLHLHKLHAKVGQRVEQGEVIAELGASGRVTGAHLDWRMNLFNKRVDPQLLVGPMPQTAASH